MKKKIITPKYTPTGIFSEIAIVIGGRCEINSGRTCQNAARRRRGMTLADWQQSNHTRPTNGLTSTIGCDKAELAFMMLRAMLPNVATVAEVEKLALDLPESQRAILAAHLLGSLPSVLQDEDGGIAEALRRDEELDANPSTGISLEQLDREVNRRAR